VGPVDEREPAAGSFVVDELTDLVEEAVLAEFDRLSERGGVLGAMETGYQRGGIQDESMLYEHRKHDGSLPIIGVNTFRRESAEELQEIELARATEAEKRASSTGSPTSRAATPTTPRTRSAAAGRRDGRGQRVRRARCGRRGCARWASSPEAFFEVGGQYRRNM
jgi:methylmalonyl-CoA mutase